METAPFYAEITRDYPVAQAYWCNAADGVRIRVAHWAAQPDRPTKGTVLLFPGRTEYIEKYAHTAGDLAAAGYATLAIDWRGQGIADRLIGDPQIGHVDRFSDFQLDVKAMLQAAAVLQLPQPYLLLAHSMGGCIGLRALHQGLPVQAAAFSGPMWGIQLSALRRPMAWLVSWTGRKLGMADRLSPETSLIPYVSEAPFEDNTLTRDPDMWAMMRQHLDQRPALSLGGPSLNWLHEALAEMLALSRLPSPPLPCLTFLGSNERIVDPQRIKDRMAAWPDGQLELVEGGEHEVLMEDEATRRRIMAQILDHFDAALAANDQPRPASA